MEAKIPQVFHQGPWQHDQVARDGDLAIYRRWKDDDAGHPVAVHYEVVCIVHQAAQVGRNGITYAAKELYPHSNRWGKDGWTCKTLPEAQVKWRSLLVRATPRTTTVH